MRYISSNFLFLFIIRLFLHNVGNAVVVTCRVSLHVILKLNRILVIPNFMVYKVL